MELASSDVEALLDRNARWRHFESRLQGVTCPLTHEIVSWQQLLKPTTWESGGVDVLFRTSTGHAISTKQARNCFVLQLRKLLGEYSEGWVKVSDGERHDAGLLKTRRSRRSENVLSECAILQELEYLEYLCSSAMKKQFAENDSRG